GHSGWMGLASELRENITDNPGAVYRAAIDRSPLVRVLLRAHPADPAAVAFDPLARRVVGQVGEATLPVHLTLACDAARRPTCPACGEHEAIRFLGLAVASLAS